MEKSATLPQHSPHPYPQIIAKFTYPQALFLIIFFIFKRLYKNEEAILL